MSLIKKIFQYLSILIIVILIHYLIIVTILRFNFDFTYNNKTTRHSQDIFAPHKVFIESHGGGNNTLESFSKVIDDNIESLETDVWLTKDNVLVLIHADSQGKIDNYLNHKGNIKELKWKKLSTLRTKKDKLKMPKLENLLKLAKNKIFINLEIKDSRVNLVFPYIIKLIEKYDFFDQITISSFYHKYFNKIDKYNKKNHKKLTFGFIYKRNMTNYDFTKRGHTLNIYWNETTKEICDKAHKNGMAVIAWFGIQDDDSLKNYKKLINKGVDVICCNYPLLAKNYRDSLFSNSIFGYLNIFVENIKKVFFKG